MQKKVRNKLDIAAAEQFDFATSDNSGQLSRSTILTHDKHIEAVLALKLVDLEVIRIQGGYRLRELGRWCNPSKLLERLGVEKLYCHPNLAISSTIRNH